jgi:hypothetical protein
MGNLKEFKCGEALFKMAHKCPDCGQVCYCNGDMDDILLNIPDDINRCIHFTQPECSGFEDKDSDEDSIQEE